MAEQVSLSGISGGASFAAKRKDLLKSVYNMDRKSIAHGNKTGDIFGDPELKQQYNMLLSKVVHNKNPQEKEKYENEFINKLIATDAKDDGQINGSFLNEQALDFTEGTEAKNVFSAKEQQFTQKENLMDYMLDLDAKDDGKINASIFKNQSVMNMLDIIDDGQLNGSIQEFQKFLSENNYNDNEIYNAFQPNGLSGSNQARIFGSGRSSQVSYNSNNYSGYGQQKPATISPDSITGTGTSASAAKIALGELGNSEANGGYKKYTNGRNEAWCADFVNYAFKKANGGKTPWGGDITSVDQLRSWGQSQGIYSQQKDGRGIKPGDIAIFKDNGRSHTGIVTKVDDDGTIHTIEGNTSDKVGERQYKAGEASLSGFVKMNSIEKDKTE